MILPTHGPEKGGSIVMTGRTPLYPRGWEIEPLADGSARITRERQARQRSWLVEGGWTLALGLIAGGLLFWPAAVYPGLKVCGLMLALQVAVRLLFLVLDPLVQEEWRVGPGSLVVQWRALGLTWRRQYTGNARNIAVKLGSTGGRMDHARPLYELYLYNGRRRERLLTAIRVDANPDAALIMHSLGTILAEATGWPFVAPTPAEPKPLVARL
jgi:hypothetical protein